MVLFLYHIKNLLAAMRCQTSPQFSTLKYGNSNMKNELDYAGDGGLLYHLSSTLLFWQNDAESCRAVDMVQATPAPGLLSRRGSLSLLWPLFQSLCLSQFVETLSCAVQGRHVLTETGMSIFEHSLAFAEAEAMVSNQLGLSPFGFPKAGGSKAARPSDEISDAIGLVSKNVLFERLNTPPEVLLMGLISSLNHLSSHILGVLNMQGRFRLINTGIWGLCFMSSFLWGFFSFASNGGADAIILRFPTVCIVGFIPHLLIFIGICICACIYFVAMLLSVFSPPNGIPAPTSFLDRFKIAHQNLQATSQLSSLRLNMHEDFYTALLKTGFAVLTVASEAVYLNEGRKISVGRLTWLEEERMQEFEASRQSVKRVPHDFSTEVASGVTLTESDRSVSKSGVAAGMSGGYAREKTTKILKTGPNGRHSKIAADGVGALQRGGRYIMAWEFFVGIFRLVAGSMTLILVKIFDTAGISRRPGWLSNNRGHKPADVQERASQASKPDSLEFWLLSDEGVLSLPQDDNVDVEAETKRRQAYATDHWGEEEDRKLDSTLYGWWIRGGWWGERDGSGSYQVTDQEEDTTSVISQSTDRSEAEWESDDHDESGRRTPTQREPYTFTRDTGPITDHSLDPSRLASLLAPKDPAEQEEAKMLAHHLTSDRIVTRSSYRHAQDFERARVLTSTRYRPATFKPSFPDGKLTTQEEAELLEHMLVSRRSPRHATTSASASASVHLPSSSSGSWQDGAEGLGAGGPQCVVCQSSPRTVLAWPCRCLSLCEECRVSLAMNNFGTCVCCRQEVIGFSRLFVP